MKKYEYKITGLDCAMCAKRIEDYLSTRKEVFSVNLNFTMQSLQLEASGGYTKEMLLKEIQKIEPGVSIEEVQTEEQEKEEEKTLSFDYLRILIGLVLFLISLVVPHFLKPFFVVASYIVLVLKTAKRAYYNLKSKTLNENSLIIISAVGAFLIGKMSEGFMVLFLYEIGKILEDKAIEKSRKSIADLMDLQVPIATMKKGNSYIEIAPSEVKVGSTILVKKGEKIPLDGILLDTATEIDAKSLTGESAYQTKEKGNLLLSGTINMKDAIHIKTTKKYEDSTASRILNLVENASSQKAKAETFVSKGARIYTPVVLVLAILVGVFLPVFTSSTYQNSIYHALLFLVVACPCSIAISVPLAYFTGIGVLSKNGVLVKGSAYLDKLRMMKKIVFDKTGTLTTGEFHVTKTITEGHLTEDEVLFYVALGEAFSTHPLAKAIIKANQKKLPLKKVSQLKEEAGSGISYVYNDEKIKIGNHKFVKGSKVLDGTVLYLSIDGKYQGAIVLEDTVKKDAKKTISTLKNKKIATLMFTGDKKEVADKIGQELGIDTIEAELLPQEKYTALEKILEEDVITAFVGDGINDSPVLRRSDIGISMGGVGSSAAIEASDVVLMEDAPSKILKAIDTSSFVHHIIVENLVFSLGIKIGTLIFSLFNFITMWQAVFADVGVTILTILNTLRILREKETRKPRK